MSNLKPRSAVVFANSIEQVRSLILEGYSVKATYHKLKQNGLFDYSLSAFRRCYYKAKGEGCLTVQSEPLNQPPIKQSKITTPTQTPAPTTDLTKLDPNNSDYQDKLAEAAFGSAD